MNGREEGRKEGRLEKKPAVKIRLEKERRQNKEEEEERRRKGKVTKIIRLYLKGKI